MSEASKSKSKTHFPLRLEAPLKAKALRFQPRSIMGARETLSRVEMNAQLRGALDSVSRADSPLCLFFLLTKAVVVIHGMTDVQGPDEANRVLAPHCDVTNDFKAWGCAGISNTAGARHSRSTGPRGWLWGLQSLAPPARQRNHPGQRRRR